MSTPKWRESSLNHHTCSLDNNHYLCDMSIRFDGKKYSCLAMSFYTEFGHELSIDEVKENVVEMAISRTKEHLGKLTRLLDSMRMKKGVNHEP